MHFNSSGNCRFARYSGLEMSTLKMLLFVPPVESYIKPNSRAVAGSMERPEYPSRQSLKRMHGR
jgi:hypothetical protein